MLITQVFQRALLLAFVQPSLASPNPRQDLQNAKVLTRDLIVVVGEPEYVTLGVDHVIIAAREEEYDDLEERSDEDHRLESRALTSDQKKALKLHNDRRKKRKLPALKWDTKLEKQALAYAKKLAKMNKMVHSATKTRVGQGENLAYAWSTEKIKAPISDGTTAWLNEQKFYKNQVIPKGDFAAYGHYTQCMWKSTTKVGIATASNGKGGWYTVARYTPGGNIVGQKPY